MVARVGDGKLFIMVHGCALGRHELAGAGSLRPERKVEYGTPPIDDLLDTIIARVGDDHVTRDPPVKRPWAIKLPRAGAVRS